MWARTGGEGNKRNFDLNYFCSMIDIGALNTSVSPSLPLEGRKTVENNMNYF